MAHLVGKYEEFIEIGAPKTSSMPPTRRSAYVYFMAIDINEETPLVVSQLKAEPKKNVSPLIIPL